MPPLYAHDPFLAIQRALAVPWLDAPMAVLSTSCEGWAVALVAVGFVLSRERELGARVRVLVPLVAGLLLAGLAVQISKRAVDLPRPLAVLGPAAVHVLLEPLRGRSFPSGHAASVAALAVFGVRRYRWHAWPLVLLALAGGLSRVYVGAHWAFDVLGGWAIGWWAASVAEPALLVAGRGARLLAALAVTARRRRQAGSRPRARARSS